MLDKMKNATLLATEWFTTLATTPGYSYYNQFVDVIYGSICCVCFLIGSSGNLASFLYFKSKKRDVSSVIYVMITTNDMVISIAVLPVGISLLSKREKGFLFGDDKVCVAWLYLWTLAVSFSIFLVLCLSVTRTISLLCPFRRQKIRYLIVAVLLYISLQLGSFIAVYVMLESHLEVVFTPFYSRCGLFVYGTPEEHVVLTMDISRNITFIAPAFVVAVSCVTSAVFLTRSNKNAQRRGLRQSRNKATVTILLFALVYGVCNIPMVVDYIFTTYGYHTNDMEWYFNLYKFDRQGYYQNAMKTQLLAVNSAANPILYFWRMPPLRDFMRRILRWSRKRKPENNATQLECGSHNRVIQNNLTHDLTAGEVVHTGL